MNIKNIIKQLLVKWMPRSVINSVQIFINFKEVQFAKSVYRYLCKHYQGDVQFSDDFQKAALKKLLLKANLNSIYWNQIFKKYDVNIATTNGFYRIPLLDKPTIRSNYNNIICQNIKSLKYYKMNTGGSTGEPLEFLNSVVSGCMDVYHQKFHFEMMGYRHKDRIFTFDGTPIPESLINRNIYWVSTGPDMPYGSRSYSSLYIKDSNIIFYIKSLMNDKPQFLRGYPSTISMIAEFIVRKDMKLDFKLKGIQLTAENVFDWQIEIISRAFNTRVYLQYGMSETGIFGFTYDDSFEYYCSPYYGLTEIIDEQGLHVNVGCEGEVVVTSLFNYAMPLIRYRTGDRAIYGGIKRGFYCIKKIIGRSQDYIYDSSGDKIPVTGIVFGLHYKAFKNIIKWQIVQDVLGEVRVKIIRGNGYTAEDEREIFNNLRNFANVFSSFEYVENIPLTARGKHLFIVQRVK
jgi:phenylacetate-CoA ligase